MKIIRAVFGTIFFILLLISIYYIHIKCFKVNVVFYAAIADSFIAVTGAGLFLFIFEYFKLLTYFEKSQLIFIWLLIGYSTAITVPTVIDRSLSFYILEKIQQRGGGIKSDSFEHVFTQEYIKEYRLVDVRLTEQIESGTIIIENNCVKLTNKGESFAKFGQYFRKNLLPKERLLMGIYTDDLTNPFRHSVTTSDYLCN